MNGERTVFLAGGVLQTQMSCKSGAACDDTARGGHDKMHPVNNNLNNATGHPAQEESHHPLRVLMVGNDLSVRGGISSVIGQIRRHDWSDSGIYIDFIPTHIEADRVRQLRFYFSAMGRIRHFLRADPPDLVHIHLSYRGSYIRKNNVRRLCLHYSVPYILHLHGSQFRSWYDSCNGRLQNSIRHMLREAAVVIVMGERWRAAILEIEPDARVRIICNAVVIPEYAFGDHRGSGVSPVQTNDKRFQVLFLGVLIPRKGVHDLLEAVRILRDSGRLGGMHFVIAGSGAEESALRDSVAAYDLTEDVTFVGWVDAEYRDALLRESQALVLPSYAEGLPVSVLEAMAYGLPVIASDVGDTAMAVHEGETGYLITPGDTAQLADRLALLYSDRELCRKMSRNARQLAAEEFSEERLYRQLESCWRVCAGREDAPDFRADPLFHGRQT